MMKKLRYILMMASMCIYSSCDLDLQESPNALTPDQADVDFLLNALEFGLNEYFFEVTDYTMEVTRMVAMEPRGGSYQTAYQPEDFDDMWEQAYAGILSDAARTISLSTEAELFVHSGIARTIQAYTLLSLVDYFGDVPWSEALQGTSGIFNPNLSDGASIYAYAEAQLDSAIADFAKESLALPDDDLFYDGDAEDWTALANTLKLKLYLQTKLVDANAAAKINDLIANAPLITSSALNWDYPFSTNAQNPDSRHPYFGDNYLSGADDYMSNYFMNLLYTGKSIIDPRIRYYFYRQTGEISDDPNELPCIVAPKPSHYAASDVYCSVGEGYWGRDHIDTDGIPPDDLLRTVFGLYPIGGRFDNNAFAPVSASVGLQGAGVHPLMHASYVDFMLAEAALTLGTTGDPRTYLEQGIRKSISEVMNFSLDNVDPDFAPTDSVVNLYVAEVLANYDAAATTDAKLGVAMTEYYIALWGNGLEAYNMYRRTGKPTNVQPALSNSPGSYIRSFPYPSNLINRNLNVTSKGDVGAKVFWDTNPDDFVK